MGGKKRRKKGGGVGGESWKRRRFFFPEAGKDEREWNGEEGRMDWENKEGRKNKLWVRALQHEENVWTLLKMKLEQWVECKFYFETEGIRFKVQCFLKTYTYINSLFSKLIHWI